MKTYSQYRQDKLIDFLFRKKRNGIFLDIGANDGISLSNTYSLEKERAWSGLCVEPIPEVYKKLVSNRNCITENCCISNQNGNVTFRRLTGQLEMLSGILDFFDESHMLRVEQEIIRTGERYEDITIKCQDINSLLEKHNISHIDYCSIDTEGAEFQIVTSIDFDKIDITAFSIENNTQDTSIREFLKKRGYEFFWSELDDFFVKKGTPRKTLFSIYVWLYKLTWKIKRRIRIK